MSDKTREQSALGLALLIYMCIVVAVITLIPFEFQLPDRVVVLWTTNPSDFVTNIFLFVPIGFLFRLARRRHADPLCLRPLAVGILLSLSIEAAQVFLPARYTQMTDVATNGLGAWLGGMAYVLAAGRLRRPAGRLAAAEMPLVGLVYLLTPLMWLNGLSLGGEASRLFMLLLLGGIGAGVICSVFIHRFKRPAEGGYVRLAAVILGWYFTGSLPALVEFPSMVVFLGVLVLLTALAAARLGKAPKTGDKRFEISTIKRVLPFYLAYLLLAVLWPTTIPFGGWPLSAGYKALATQQRFLLTFRLVELIAAFTLLGYMIAEMRGRKDESADRTLAWACAASLAAALSVEILRTFPLLAGINFLFIAVVIAAGLYGAAIYRLQLSVIERLR